MILNEILLKAISWTLLHSLWQGVILALLTGLAVLLTKRSKAALRYTLLSVLLMAFIITIGLTFKYEYQFGGAAITGHAIAGENHLAAGQPVAMPGRGSEDYFRWAVAFLNNNSAIIVLIWFLVFAIKCFGIIRSLVNIHHIRNYHTLGVPEFWNSRISELCQKVNIRRHIVLLESQLVKVPSVTGFFKPIILIPAGMLCSLPQSQVEAILLHELAHICRKDYFVNLIQAFLGTILFFNPGFLWLSALIKEERENCCDDIAVGITQDKAKFINALISFKEYGLITNDLAMNFSRKKQFLQRAKRMLEDTNSTLNYIEKVFLCLSICIFTALMIACTSDDLSGTTANIADTAARQFEELPEDGDAYTQSIIDEMISDKIVMDGPAASFKLSTAEFIVNGIRQPEGIHKKFKGKFLRFKNITATYNNYNLESENGL